MKVLVCTDGQAHSRAAMEHAIRMGLTAQVEVTGLHVLDPYLKKFYNELYSQGRKRYLEYVEECLQQEAERARFEFLSLCRAGGLECRFRLRRGEPLREILAEVRELRPDVVITGGKKLNAWGRFRSRNLPRQLQKKAGLPVTVVAVTSRPADVPVRSCS